MPSRTIPLINGQIYHIYNRGSEKRRIFENRWDYQRLLRSIKYYQIEGPKPKFSRFSSLHKIDPAKKIVEILAYCLMPNHIHFIVTQIKDNGITEFIGRTTNSYTKYYNTKHNRIGPLFQGEFKSVLVESDEQLIHLSRYIHLNPLSSFLVKNLDDYEWSSFIAYTEDGNDLCTKEQILGLFKSPQDYKQFVLDQSEYAQQLHLIKHQLIDIEYE